MPLVKPFQTLSYAWLQGNEIVSGYNFCNWDYTICNGGIDIIDLTPSSESQLFGSLPPEIGLLTSL